MKLTEPCYFRGPLTALVGGLDVWAIGGGSLVAVVGGLVALAIGEINNWDNCSTLGRAFLLFRLLEAENSE